MSVEQEMIVILNRQFEPQHLKVTNQSHLHQGHAGDDGSGESHFHLEIASEKFSGKTRLEHHRMINEALADLLKNRIHALSIKVL
jgi:BolA family transcriptional regulator, general stress-responsive regulator